MNFTAAHKMWLIIGLGLLPLSALMLFVDMHVSDIGHTRSITSLFYVGIAILASSIFVMVTTVISALRTKN